MTYTCSLAHEQMDRNWTIGLSLCQWMKEGTVFLHSRENNFSWAFCFLFHTTHWRMSESPSLSHICHLKHEKTLSIQHKVNTAHAAGWVSRVNHWMTINDCSSVSHPHFISSEWMQMFQIYLKLIMWCKHWMMFLFVPDKLGSCNVFLIRTKWCMFNGSWLEMKWSTTKWKPQWQRENESTLCVLKENEVSQMKL